MEGRAGNPRSNCLRFLRIENRKGRRRKCSFPDSRRGSFGRFRRRRDHKKSRRMCRDREGNQKDRCRRIPRRRDRTKNHRKCRDWMGNQKDRCPGFLRRQDRRRHRRIGKLGFRPRLLRHLDPRVQNRWWSGCTQRGPATQIQIQKSKSIGVALAWFFLGVGKKRSASARASKRRRSSASFRCAPSFAVWAAKGRFGRREPPLSWPS